MLLSAELMDVSVSVIIVDSEDVQNHNGFRNTDMIDVRSRVSNYSVSAGARSPFEFLGRSFNGGQHSSKDIVASDESIVVDFKY